MQQSGQVNDKMQNMITFTHDLSKLSLRESDNEFQKRGPTGGIVPMSIPIKCDAVNSTHSQLFNKGNQHVLEDLDQPSAKYIKPTMDVALNQTAQQENQHQQFQTTKMDNIEDNIDQLQGVQYSMSSMPDVFPNIDELLESMENENKQTSPSVIPAQSPIHTNPSSTNGSQFTSCLPGKTLRHDTSEQSTNCSNIQQVFDDIDDIIFKDIQRNCLENQPRQAPVERQIIPSTILSLSDPLQMRNNLDELVTVTSSSDGKAFLPNIKEYKFIATKLNAVPTGVQIPPVPLSKYRPIQPKHSSWPNKVILTPNGISTGEPTNTGVQPLQPEVPTHTGKQPGMPTSRSNISQFNTSASYSKKLIKAKQEAATIPLHHLIARDNAGNTELHRIAQSEANKCMKLYMVEALLERYHEMHCMDVINAQNNRQETALYLAVLHNNHHYVRLFVMCGADPNVYVQNSSKDGQTREVKAAIHVASSNGGQYHDTLNALLTAPDINVDICSNNGETALHYAVMAHSTQHQRDSVVIIQTLINAGADPAAQETHGETPLMYAVSKKDLRLVEAILQKIPRHKVKNIINTKSLSGKSCFSIAEAFRNSSGVEIWNKLWTVVHEDTNS